MSVAARSILIGVVVIAAYYALVFGYAAHVRSERLEHVAWRFPLRGGSDYCADPMPNGACVCSDAGTVYIVKDGKQLGKFEAYKGNSENREYPPFEGYQWVGGTQDNLAFVSAARPPMDELSLYAIETDGHVRWQAKMPPGEIVSWIACSPDSVFVQTYDVGDPQPHQANIPTVSRVSRYDLQGKLIYSVEPKIPVLQLGVAEDNWVYVADNMSQTIEARDPSGKLMWQTKTGGYMPAYSHYMDSKTLYYLDAAHKLHGVGRDGKERFTATLPTGSQQTTSIWEEFRRGMSGGNYGGWNSFNTGFLADGGGQLYAIDDDRQNLIAIGGDGKQLWQQRLRSHALCVIADSKGRAYVTLQSGGLVCYSAAGKELWRNSSMHSFSSAMSVGADDRVLVEADGELICIDP